MKDAFWRIALRCLLLLAPGLLGAQVVVDSALQHRRFDQVALLYTHNAYNVRGHHRLPNQNLTVAQQLELGVRGLMLDVYAHHGRVMLYHANRLLGHRPLQEDLGAIKAFLDAHPLEVMSIIFESYISPAQLEDELTRAGLMPYLYKHTPGAPWPTLAHMAATQQRLVIFSEKDRDNPYPWLLHAWDHMTENRYSNHSRSDFDTRYNRGDSTGKLFLLNHFITHRKFGYGLPDSASVANAPGNLMDHALEAWSRTGHFPNFVAVDFVDVGYAPSVVRQLNALWQQTEPPGQCLIDTAFRGSAIEAIIVKFAQPMQEPYSLVLRDLASCSELTRTSFPASMAKEALLLAPHGWGDGHCVVELWLQGHFERYRLR